MMSRSSSSGQSMTSFPIVLQTDAVSVAAVLFETLRFYISNGALSESMPMNVAVSPAASNACRAPAEKPPSPQ